jgi:hypothetical protein
MELISDELKFAPVVNNHSTTAFRKISPQGVSTQIALSASASVGPTEFIIPPSVFNPAKSRLNFQLELPDPGATVNVNWVDANLLSTISRVVLYDSNTNAVWLDCSNFEKYAALVVPAGTSYEEFKTKSGLWQSATYAQKMGIANTDSEPFPVEDIHKSNSLVNVTNLNTAVASTAGANAYEGRRYVIAGTDSEKSFLDVSLPLSAFKFTALALNKNMYSPSNLVLQLYWNSTNNFAWSTTSTTSPASGTAIGATAYINNVSLQLANEQNLSIISKITQQVMSSGISLPIAYPTTTRQAISSSTAHSYQLNLTKGYGQRILALITAPFSAGSTAINAANSHIRGNLTTYNTFMNNIATKYQAGYDCRLGQDFFYGNREYVEGSTVQTLGEYAVAEWIHVDSYFGEKPLHLVDQTQIDGYDVGATASAWQIQANLSSAQAITWVTAIIGQKMLTVSSQGSMVA